MHHRYRLSQDCPLTGDVVRDRCSGFDDYDTSKCIPCDAQCIGWQDDPQGDRPAHTWKCNQTQTYIHTYIHTHTHTPGTRNQPPPATVALQEHTVQHTYIHTYMHTYIHTYTHLKQETSHHQRPLRCRNIPCNGCQRHSLKRHPSYTHDSRCYVYGWGVWGEPAQETCEAAWGER